MEEKLKKRSKKMKKLTLKKMKKRIEMCACNKGVCGKCPYCNSQCFIRDRDFLRHSADPREYKDWTVKKLLNNIEHDDNWKIKKDSMLDLVQNRVEYCMQHDKSINCANCKYLYNDCRICGVTPSSLAGMTVAELIRLVE